MRDHARAATLKNGQLAQRLEARETDSLPPSTVDEPLPAMANGIDDKQRSSNTDTGRS